MLLFKRILNFRKSSVDPEDKRQIVRHPVGHPFPFKAVINLIGHDADDKPLMSPDQSRDWAGRLVNLSSSGASIQIHSAAVGNRGEPCRFKLSLDDYLLEIPGVIAHFRTYPNYTLCGLSFEFLDFETQKAYKQVLEPVAMGASLAPVPAKNVDQDIDGLHKEQYRGAEASLLTVWRQTPGGGVHSFDFRMNDYGVR